MWEGDFFSALKEQLLLIMDYGFNGFVYDKHTAVHFTRHELFDWSHVDYLWIIVMFLSAVWTIILTAIIPLFDLFFNNVNKLQFDAQLNIYVNTHTHTHTQQWMQLYTLEYVAL